MPLMTSPYPTAPLPLRDRGCDRSNLRAEGVAFGLVRCDLSWWCPPTRTFFAVDVDSPTPHIRHHRMYATQRLALKLRAFVMILLTFRLPAARACLPTRATKYLRIRLPPATFHVAVATLFYV